MNSINKKGFLKNLPFRMIKSLTDAVNKSTNPFGIYSSLFKKYVWQLMANKTPRFMKNLYTLCNKAYLLKSNAYQLTAILTVAVFLLGASSVLNAQIANKDLYLKIGQLLNREQPTTETFLSTAPLFKKTAVIGATTSGSSGNGLGITSPLTIAHTTGTNSDRLMLVTIVYDPANTTPASVVYAVTYGGVSLTKLDEVINGTSVKVELWYLKSPNSGSSNVVISWTSPTTNLQIVAGVTTLYDVDLINTFGPVNKTFNTGANSTLPVASQLGDFIFDAIGYAKGSINIGSGQTQIYNTGTNKLNAGSSSKPGAASSTNMSWAFSSNPYAHIGVAIKGQSNDIAFTQNPAMCSSFTVKAGQNISVLANAAVKSGTASGTPLPMSLLLKKNGTTFFSSNSAVNSGLGAINSTGTLTWTGQLSPATDVIFNPGDILSAEFSSDYTSAGIHIDYDATGKQSKITLPTTTYINVNSLNAYTAAYAGGSITTQSGIGVTNYLRAVVSDPFGASDITGLNFTINGGIPVAGTLVNTNTAGCTKTFEYPWTPTTAGTYN